MSDDQAITQVAKHLELAWNASDSVAFAAVFSRDADFIHVIGGHYRGRSAIEAGHRQIWDTIYRDSKVIYDVERIRYVRDDVAIVFLLSTLSLANNGESRRLQARPTLVLSKENGVWQIVSLQNTLVGEPRAFEDAAVGYPKPS